MLTNKQDKQDKKQFKLTCFHLWAGLRAGLKLKHHSCIRNILLCLFYASFCYSFISTHFFTDNFWDKLVVSTSRYLPLDKCPNLPLVTVTDTTCSYPYAKWGMRFCLILGLPLIVFIAPVCLRSSFKDKIFLEATNLTKLQIESYLRKASVGIRISYLSAVVCLFILDIPPLSSEAYQAMKLNNFQILSKIQPSVWNWLAHLCLYHGIIGGAIYHELAIIKLLNSVDNNTFIDPKLVVKNRKSLRIRRKIAENPFDF